jgi:hypothetical protein
MNFRRLKCLILQLKSYGLNPNDWRIDRDSLGPHVFGVHHRNDQDFKLVGFLDLSGHDHSEIKLRNLMVASI